MTTLQRWREPTSSDLEGKKATLFKLILIGGPNVNKTGLMVRYTQNNSDGSSRSPIGVDFVLKKLMSPEGELVKLQIWDTAGQEKFRTITSSYYRGTHGVMVVFDSTNRQSYDAVLNDWIPEVESKTTDNVAKIVVASKGGDPAKVQVTEEDIQVLSEKSGYPVVEVDPQEGSKVSQAFETILEIMWKRRN